MPPSLQIPRWLVSCRLQSMSSQRLSSCLAKPLSSSLLSPSLSLFRYMSTVLTPTTSPKGTIGFVGLGSMGSKMIARLVEDGLHVHVYDKDAAAVDKAVALRPTQVFAAPSIEALAAKTSVVISILPNDAVVSEVSNVLLTSVRSSTSPLTHISCSTISPVTSRKLETQFAAANATYISSPVFARPDGIAKRQATWMVSGQSVAGRALATDLLTPLGNVVDFGDDVGAANVVKLCGNFLIASSIEAIGEAMALSEKHGVDRLKVMELLSSTIFNCLIYKGYGDRVSKRDHRPGGFSLALGLKDVSLVNQAAREADVPMPFLSVLLDRYVSAKAKGRADFDWSAIGLNIAEDAGLDVSKDVAKNRKDIDEGRTY